MWYRIGQFWRAVTAHVTINDYCFLREHLSEGEQALFFQMAVYDQRHCLDTARAAQSLGQAYRLEEHQLRVVTKAALLHDVGKVAGDIGLVARVLITLLELVSPQLVKKSAAKGRRKMSLQTKGQGFAYACFVHVFHPERGARMLAAFGCEPEVVRLVRQHHKKELSTSDHIKSVLLRILQEADRDS